MTSFATYPSLVVFVTGQATRTEAALAVAVPLFLASDDAAAITGQNVVIDGGHT
jgi:hypothetical protein